MTRKKTGALASSFDIGDHAEGYLDYLCREVGMIATSPRKDRNGWDFYITLPGDTSTNNDLSTPPILNCSIQVKARYNTTRSPSRIKLSNLNRMISEPVPWFIFVVTYSQKNKPIQGVLIHIDDNWINFTAEEIWKNQRSSKPRALHKILKSITWTSAEVLSELSGEALLRQLQSSIGDTNKYVERKISARADAGFGKYRYSVKVTSKSPTSEHYRDLAALAVGELKEIPVAFVETSEIRFGIEGDAQKSAGSTISLEPPSSPIAIEFAQTRPTRERFSVVFDMFSASRVFPFLPPEFRRIRLAIPFLTLDITPSKKKGTAYNWHFKIPNAPISLDKLAQVSRVLSSLTDNNAPPPQIYFSNGKPTKLQLDSAANFTDTESIEKMTKAIISADTLVKVFNIDSGIIVSLHQLCEQSASLQALAGIFSNQTEELSVTLNSTDDSLNNTSSAHVRIIYVQIGDKLLMATVAITGIAKRVDDKIVISEARTRVLDKIIASEKEAQRRSFAKKVLHLSLKNAREFIQREGFRLLDQVN